MTPGYSILKRSACYTDAMKRSAQEILELAVFALIALVVGVLLVWGVGWVFTGVGWLLRLIASFVWSLLRFIIPIAIVAGVIYLVVKLLSSPRKARESTSTASTTTTPNVTPPGPIGSTMPGSTFPTTPPASAEPLSSAPASTPATPGEDAPIDVHVDTSGFKEMDDLAEDLADDRADDGPGPEGDERRLG